MNTLISKCLDCGITIKSYNQFNVLKAYETMKIPDEVLKKMKKEEIESYVLGLRLAMEEMSMDWSRGHEILVSIGFVEEHTDIAHRRFTKLVYKGN